MESPTTSTAQRNYTLIQNNLFISVHSQQMEQSPLTQESTPCWTTKSLNGDSSSPLAQESHKKSPPKTQKITKTLEEIENEPYPSDAHVWNIKASEVEHWRQILKYAKYRFYGSLNAN